MARALVEDWVFTVETVDGHDRVVPVPNATVQVRERNTTDLVAFPIYADDTGGSDIGPVLTASARGVVRFYVDVANMGRFDLYSPASGSSAAQTHEDVPALPAPDYLVLYSDPTTDTIDGNVYTDAELQSPEVTTPTVVGGSITALTELAVATGGTTDLAATGGTKIKKAIIGSGSDPTNNYLVYNDSGDEYEGFEFYRNGIRQMLFAERGVIFGPRNQWFNNTRTSQTIPFGVIETTSPVDVNNGSKAAFNSLNLQEWGPDPCEINMYVDGRALVTDPFAAALAGAHPGMLVWWTYNGSGWNANAQISSKTTENQSTTASGGSIALLTAPNAAGAGVTRIPRLIVGPKGWSIIDDRMPSADGAYWNETYINAIASLLELRGATAPTLTVRNYSTRDTADRARLRFVFGEDSNAWDLASSAAAQIEVGVAQASPIRSYLTISVNDAGTQRDGLRIDEAANVRIFRSLVLDTLTAAGDLPYSISTAGEIGRIPAGTTSQVLIGGSSPAFGAVTSAMISLSAIDPPGTNQLTRESIFSSKSVWTVSAGVVTERNYHNITSVTRNSNGDYSVAFNRDHADAFYNCGVTVYDPSNNFRGHVIDKAAGSLRFQILNNSNAVGDPSANAHIEVWTSGLQA